jgi:hypothetical protein
MTNNNSSNIWEKCKNAILYKSKRDLYENLYLKAIIDSYIRIDKTQDFENNIRDRFVWDLETDVETQNFASLLRIIKFCVSAAHYKILRLCCAL